MWNRSQVNMPVFRIKLFSTVADWDSMGRVITETRGRVF